MVKELNGYYFCKKCNLKFETKALAQQCEDFCTKNNACSMELIAKSVQ